jgi:hypothetical protein
VSMDRVVHSVNNDVADRCVDFILRPDGSHVFKEFRRDPEDQRGWFLTSFDESSVFARYEDAVDAAVNKVVWLKEAMERKLSG